MSYILGIDEAGRGAWAGPLVVGAVILGGLHLEGLTDSKMLSRQTREELSECILQGSFAAGLGWATSKEIDKYGLTKSTSLAMKRAISGIDHGELEIIIDGNINYLTELKNAKCMVKADLHVPAVSAAGIIAKVARDDYMKKLAVKFPAYGFENHVGYGTRDHIANINKLGVCVEHRLSYKPLSVFA